MRNTNRLTKNKRNSGNDDASAVIRQFLKIETNMENIEALVTINALIHSDISARYLAPTISTAEKYTHFGTISLLINISNLDIMFKHVKFATIVRFNIRD